MNPRPPCLRCGEATTISGHRGLCHACWMVPAIREQYPSGARPPTAAACVWRPRPATRPTDAPPGSEARILVYMERVERGEAVFCSEDVGADLR